MPECGPAGGLDLVRMEEGAAPIAVVKLAIPAASQTPHRLREEVPCRVCRMDRSIRRRQAISLHDGKTEYVAGQRNARQFR